MPDISLLQHHLAAQDVHRVLPFSPGRPITLDGPGAALNKRGRAAAVPAG